MTENNTKSVSNLYGIKFYIPDYQRRYRWNNEQVQALLDDINLFDDSRSNSWYCMQPLTVKKYRDGYEVIDGQQRLTTIFLILKYLKGKKAENDLFSLEYKNQKLNNGALTAPDEIKDDCTLNEEYIKCAYKKIREYENFENDDKKRKFLKKLEDKTKFIWYEIQNEGNNPIEVFKRLNVGKIPLMQSELIKALFLKRSNFENVSLNSIYLTRLEIANEWHEIENKLQDDKFWLFICNKPKQLNNRIELIFTLLNKKQKNSDKNWLFNIYFEKYKNLKADFVNVEWAKIKYFFYTLEEWFNDYELRNFIGFLQFKDNNFSIKEISENSKKMEKSAFKAFIKEMVNNYIQETVNKLETLQKDSDDEKIRTLLLLFNVIESNRRSEFFRYDLFKKTNWDIEHIVPQGGDAAPSGDNQYSWLKVTKEYYENESKRNNLACREAAFLKKIKEFYNNKNYTDEEFQILYNRVNKYYLNKIIKIDDIEAINAISNLVLLDAATNRGYKNVIFPIKRKNIIELDKAGIKKNNKGEIQYLLPCTRNAFLKYYSEISSVPNKWSSDDAENYLKALKKDFMSLNKSDNAGENNE